MAKILLCLKLQDGNDAILIATGSKDTLKMDTPGIDFEGIYDGYQFLEGVFVNGVEESTRIIPTNMSWEMMS